MQVSAIRVSEDRSADDAAALLVLKTTAAITAELVG
jgi:hypothetical protein